MGSTVRRNWRSLWGDAGTRCALARDRLAIPRWGARAWLEEGGHALAAKKRTTPAICETATRGGVGSGMDFGFLGCSMRRGTGCRHKHVG